MVCRRLPSNFQARLPRKCVCYVGENCPSYSPLEIRDVALPPENTIHYGIADSNANEECLSVFSPCSDGQNGRRFEILI